jgi:hypothetical protein
MPRSWPEIAQTGRKKWDMGIDGSHGNFWEKNGRQQWEKAVGISGLP